MGCNGGRDAARLARHLLLAPEKPRMRPPLKGLPLKKAHFRKGQAMKVKTSQQLYNYWNELRGGRLAPRRFEVEPSAISAILPDTFILERVDRMDYVFRLAGTRICEAFGREFRGRNLLELWPLDDREVVIRVLESVTRDGGVGVIGLMASAPGGRTAAFEMVLLPLIHTGQAIGRVLGGLTPLSSLQPYGLEGFSTIELNTFEVIWPDGRPFAVLSRGEAPAPFLRDSGPSRLVRSDRRAFRVFDGGRKDPLIGARPIGPK